MSIAHISYIIALWATSTGNSISSHVFLALVLVIHCPCICSSSSGAVSTGAGRTTLLENTLLEVEFPVLVAQSAMI